MELEIKRVHVTPALATEWLTKNVNNYRKLRRQQVNELKNALEQGLWKVTHQGIAFDKEGNLVDGQHRLTAIAESGITAEVMVAFGVEIDTVDYMDIGAKRQFSDVLARRGEKNSVLLASVILRLWYWYENDDHMPAKNYKPTFEERLKFLEARPEIRDSIIISKTADTTNTILSITHYIFGNIESDDRDWFFENLLSFETTVPTDHPIAILRSSLFNDKKDQKLGARSSDIRHLAIIIKTWNAFRSRNKIHHLRYKASEAFPEPM